MEEQQNNETQQNNLSTRTLMAPRDGLRSSLPFGANGNSTNDFPSHATIHLTNHPTNMITTIEVAEVNQERNNGDESSMELKRKQFLYENNSISINEGDAQVCVPETTEGIEKPKVKRRHTDWSQFPEAKQQAINMVIAQNGSIRPALRKLQNDPVLNENGVYNGLPAGTLNDWYKRHQHVQEHGEKERTYPKHMKSIVSEEVYEEMFLALDKLFAKDNLLNCTKVRPIFKNILIEKQPDILSPPDGSGTFSLSRGWINNFRAKWKNHRNIQDKPKSNAQLQVSNSENGGEAAEVPYRFESTSAKQQTPSSAKQTPQERAETSSAKQTLHLPNKHQTKLLY